MKYSIFFLLLFSKAVFAQEANSAGLDSITKEIFLRTRMAGASVLVAQKGNISLNKGYGFAHIGLGVKSDTNTKYNLIGPGMIILGAAILQQVEKGKLSLDDEVSEFLPAFPAKGKKLKIRHLLSSTSGLVDYHYLGDPIESINHTMHLDEVIDLFAGRELLIEPGSQFDWSASNWALLVAVLEASSGQSFHEYLNRNLFSPVSASNIELYDPNGRISNHAKGYKLLPGSLGEATESLLRYDPSFHLVGTATDLFKVWQGVKSGSLLSKDLFRLMLDSVEAAKNKSAHFRYAIASRQEQWGTAFGFRGGMPGYSTFFAYYPTTDVTIIVLANTSPQQAYEIGRQLERYVHGWPLLPLNDKTTGKPDIIPIAKKELELLSGTYKVSRMPGTPSTPKSFLLYQRTFRIFFENGKALFQFKGELPQELIKTDENNFILETTGDLKIQFTNPGKNLGVTIVYKNGVTDKGERIGPPDVKTFHESRAVQYQGAAKKDRR